MAAQPFFQQDSEQFHKDLSIHTHLKNSADNGSGFFIYNPFAWIFIQAQLLVCVFPDTPLAFKMGLIFLLVSRGSTIRS